ncbi:LexA family transcriptional regulator [Aureimonas sp. AU4]|uniref:LexA family protein n=1 Tax=Aureimonas sp. AU4 TaxID=1638163 RepID=UPI000783575A|nr:hypothetical protein [Aureimonas sp. AU4]
MKTEFEDALAAAQLTAEERELLERLRNHPTVVKLAAMRLALSDHATFGLTPRMRQTIEAIRDLTEENNISPTVEEIGRRVGLVSKSGVHRLLSALAERLLVTWSPGRTRSIRIIEPTFAPRPEKMRRGNR